MFQEVLLNAWKGWPSYRGDAKFSTWLYRICLNTIFTLKRKKQHIDYKDSLEPLSPAVENSGIQKEEAHAYSRQLGCYRKQAVPLSRCTWMVLRTVKLQVY